jgi:hypothetical protein
MIKILLLSFFFTLHSQATIVPKECDIFAEEVLHKAVREDLKVSDSKDHDHNYRFIENEKEALKLIMAFDVNQLGLNQNADIRKQEIALCAEIDSMNYCETTFAAFNYFRALLYGVKNYKWSQSTKSQALDKTWHYLKYIQQNKPSLLQTNLVLSLIKTMGSYKLVSPGATKKALLLIKQIEIENLRLQNLQKNKKKPLPCSDFKEMVSEEIKVNDRFIAEIEALIKLEKKIE